MTNPGCVSGFAEAIDDQRRAIATLGSRIVSHEQAVAAIGPRIQRGAKDGEEDGRG